MKYQMETLIYFKNNFEINKLNKYINDELNYINYEDYILDFIYEEYNIDITEIIFPLVKNKTLLTRFTNLISYSKYEEERWLNVIFNNGFSKTSQIDIYEIRYDLFEYASKYGHIDKLEYLLDYFKENLICIDDKTIEYVFKDVCRNNQRDVAYFFISYGIINLEKIDIDEIYNGCNYRIIDYLRELKEEED